MKVKFEIYNDDFKLLIISGDKVSYKQVGSFSNISDNNTIKQKLSELQIGEFSGYIWPQQAVIVPRAIWESSQAEAYLNVIYGKDDKLLVKSEKITALDSVIVYKIKPSQQLGLIALYTGADIHPAIRPVLEYGCTNFLKATLVCFKQNKRLDMFAFDNKSLKFYNHYTIENDEEALYYISLACKKDFDSLCDIQINLSKENPLFELLTIYHKNLYKINWHYFSDPELEQLYLLNNPALYENS